MTITVLRGEPAPSAAPINLLPKRPGIRKNPGLFLFLFFSSDRAAKAQGDPSKDALNSARDL
jgi:hypothetical protein